jgi:hypothetical protein
MLIAAADRHPFGASKVRLRITRQPSGSIDGIQLDDMLLGSTYEVRTLLACYLLAEGLAVPVPDDSPARSPLRTRVRFDVRPPSVDGKVNSILESRTPGPARAPLSEAADKPPRRKRR